MTTLEDIRRIALALPGAIEVDYRGNWFQVGKKAFVLYSATDDCWIFKLPHARQELLFEARPEVFRPYRAGALRWSYVDVDALTLAEAEDYVTDAWTTIVPKKVSGAYLARAIGPD